MSLLEVCVDEVAGLHAAVEGGADRIELCSSLDLGGLTPSAGLMAAAGRLPVPVIALIRPRSGGFVYSADDERVMRHDIDRAADLGLAGVALGALTSSGQLDLALLERLIQHAKGLQLTLHRAFDLVSDQAEGLEQAIALGFDRILTSGGATTAPGGAAQLAALVRQSQGRIGILVGSGITAANVEALMRSTGAHEVHASCRASIPEPNPAIAAMGFGNATPRSTSVALVRALRASMPASSTSF